MQKKHIGYICAFGVLILTAVLPIIIQECSLNIFILMFIVPFFSLLFSAGYLYAFDPSNWTNSLKLLSLSSPTFSSVCLLGIEAYLIYLLEFEGSTYTPTSVFNALFVFQILAGVHYTIKHDHLPTNLFEAFGVLLMILGSSVVVVHQYQIEKQKRQFLYGVGCLVLCMILTVTNRLQYATVVTDPWVSLVIQSVIMSVFAIFVLVGSKLLFPKYIKNGEIWQFTNLHYLFYIVFVVVVVANLIPDVLEFAEYDDLTFAIIALFLIGQIILGYFLDVTYYKQEWTLEKKSSLLMICLGVASLIYGFKQTNQSSSSSS